MAEVGLLKWALIAEESVPDWKHAVAAAAVVYRPSDRQSQFVCRHCALNGNDAKKMTKKRRMLGKSSHGKDKIDEAEVTSPSRLMQSSMKSMHITLINN